VGGRGTYYTGTKLMQEATLVSLIILSKIAYLTPIICSCIKMILGILKFVIIVHNKDE
jgi:hypothetical protein